MLVASPELDVVGAQGDADGVFPSARLGPPIDPVQKVAAPVGAPIPTYLYAAVGGDPEDIGIARLDYECLDRSTCVTGPGQGPGCSRVVAPVDLGRWRRPHSPAGGTWNVRRVGDIGSAR